MLSTLAFVCDERQLESYNYRGESIVSAVSPGACAAVS